METRKTKRGTDSRATEQQLPAEATGLPPVLTVAGAMSVPRIKLQLAGATKDNVLHELAGLVVDPQRTGDVETLYHALKAREELCSTCIDEGVAIPHSRNAIVGLVKQPVIAYGRHRGLAFGALDGKPVQHFFLLCAPNVREHLQLLSRLARLLKDALFRAKLETTKQPEDVLALVRDTEQSLLPG